MLKVRSRLASGMIKKAISVITPRLWRIIFASWANVRIMKQSNDSNVRPSRAVTPEPMSEDVDIPNEPDDLPF
jgi:hypothetical protein